MIAKSVNGVDIRLTPERVKHILSNHPELDGLIELLRYVVQVPDSVHAGNNKELLAIKYIKEIDKSIVVVYRELSINQEQDGFIVTAYLTSRPESVTKRMQIWP
jgi:hypothetical protein